MPPKKIVGPKAEAYGQVKSLLCFDTYLQIHESNTKNKSEYYEEALKVFKQKISWFLTAKNPELGWEQGMTEEKIMLVCGDRVYTGMKKIFKRYDRQVILPMNLHSLHQF